jgi:hypothetical protein
MRRRAITAAAAIAVGLTVPASAGPPDIFENQYEGRVESTPTTYFGFDVVKKQGKKKVAKVTALMRYNCVNGDGADAAARAQGRLRVKRDGSFQGTVSGQPLPFRAPHRQLGPPGSARIKYRVEGTLLRRGKAKGKVDATLTFTPIAPRGDGPIRCYSGKLDWKARRGAEAPVKP